MDPARPCPHPVRPLPQPLKNHCRTVTFADTARALELARDVLVGEHVKAEGDEDISREEALTFAKDCAPMALGIILENCWVGKYEAPRPWLHALGAPQVSPGLAMLGPLD